MVEINFPILISQIITFIIGMWLVWKFFIGPLTEKLQQRKDNIKNTLDTAESTRNEVEKLKAEYAKQILDIESKAKEIISKASSEGQKQKEDIIKLALEQSKQLLEKTNAQLEEEKKRIIKETENYVGLLAVQIAEKIMKKTLDKKTQENFFSEMIDDLSRNTSLPQN